MALTVCGWPRRRAQGKVDGLVQRHPLSRPSPGINGLVRTPPEQRDPAAIATGISACEALFAMLDDELAKTPWLSGEQFGLGDIAVAPFVQSVVDPRQLATAAPSAALVSAD